MSLYRDLRVMAATMHGIGIGVGEIFFLVTARNSTDTYYTYLREKYVPEGKIYTSLSGAYDAMTTNRNDTLFVFPGNHTVSASLTWAKANTNIVGVGAPRMNYHAAGDSRLVCTTAAVAQILSITAANVRMYGIGTYNAAADSGNLYDISIGANNFYAEGCHFRGGNNTSQTTASGTAPAGVPITLATGGASGNGTYFYRCTIGSSGNAVRTKGPGCLFIPGSSGGFGLTFDDCTFSMWSKAATGSNLSMVFLTGSYSVPRELLFKNCFFYNYTPTTPENLNVCVQDDITTDHRIVFMNCASMGIDAWGSNTNNVYVASGAQPVAHGGIAVVGDIS